MGAIDDRIAALGLELPPPWTPRGKFAPFRRDGQTVFLSGQICEWDGEVTLAGPVGTDDAAIEEAAKAARVCALNLIYCLRLACDGDLDRVEAFIRVGGFVNCLSGFPYSPRVINGASDVFHEVFGERGVHARTAVGVAGLPGNAAVEVDAIVRVLPG